MNAISVSELRKNLAATIDRVAAKTYRIYWLDFVSCCCGGNSRIVWRSLPMVWFLARFWDTFCD